MLSPADRRRIEAAARKAGWWHSEIKSLMNPPLWATNIASIICGGHDAEEIEAAYLLAARLLGVRVGRKK